MQSLRYPTAVMLIGLSFAAATGGASRARATTILAYSQLAGLRDFRVSVQTRSKGTNGLRGNIRETENLLSSAIVDTLRAGGLKYEETSQFALVLIVDFSYDARESDWVALAVRLELYERVELERALPKRISTRGHSVVSWRWSDVDLVNVAHAEPTLVSMAKRAAESLVSEVKVATEVFPPKE